MDGTMEGDSWKSNSLNLAKSIVSFGGIGALAFNSHCRRSPISVQIAMECVSSIETFAMFFDIVVIPADF
jgi:hypothetical protein